VAKREVELEPNLFRIVQYSKLSICLNIANRLTDKIMWH